ncbi:uncharacterized protein [Rutidosis leptorrhynchoides]|uniref:uncharacterized protein n=1 Tax=Rutidosis leptorrhynchoides TaxID=125765 RepID=UPI003A99E397
MSVSSDNNSIEQGDFIMRTPEFITNQVFGSREELIDWVQTLAKSLGIVVVLRRSNKRASGFVYNSTLICDRGTSNELENLFFIHPISFNIWRAYPHVLIIDATYKTNRYNMPFVEIGGVTSTSKTFCIAFAFIHDEMTVKYEWVLNCLKLTLGECMLPRVIVTDREMALINACRGVFPDAARLLCRWHIRHNIIDKWKRSFKRKVDWTTFYDLWTLLEGSSTLKTYIGYYKQLESFLKRLNLTRKTATQEPRVKKNTRGRLPTKKTQQKRRADHVHQDSRRYSCSDMPNFAVRDSIKDPARHSSYNINLNEEPEIDLNEEPEIDLNEEPEIDLNEVPYEFSSSYIFNQNEMSRMHNSYMFNGIPKLFHQYIKNIYNVEGDGNCGYRAFAVSLMGNEQYYESIRYEMKEELRNKPEFYEIMFDKEIKSLKASLSYVGSPCPPEYWMMMPYAGILIANRFGVIVHSLSMSESSTIFSFWMGPEEFQQIRVLTIALVNCENHYVTVELQGDYPMPPVTSYFHDRYITTSAARWKEVYKERFEQFIRFNRREADFVDLND